MSGLSTVQFNDTVKARYIDKDLTNNYVPRGNKRKIRSQLAVYEYIKLLEQPDSRAYRIRNNVFGSLKKDFSISGDT